MSHDGGLYIPVEIEQTAADAEISNLEARLAALEIAFNKTGTAAKGATDSTEAAGIAAKSSGDSAQMSASGWGLLGVGLQDVNENAYKVARGLDAAGLSAAANATKVGVMTDALISMQGAIPGLLVLTAVLSGVVAAFSTLKAGVDTAIQMQAQTETMRATLEAFGQNVGDLDAKLQSFLQTEVLAFGYQPTELIAGLNQLVIGAHNVADAETQLQVAEELSRAKHFELEKVIRAVTAAQGGMGMQIARLDPNVRKLVAAHADLDKIMQRVHEDMVRQASNTNDVETNTARMHAEFTLFTGELASRTLPAINNFILGLMALPGYIGEVADDIGHLIAGGLALLFSALVGILELIRDVGMAAYDFFHGNFGKMSDDMHGFTEATKLATLAGKEFQAAFAPMHSPADLGASLAKAAHRHDNEQFNFQNDPSMRVGLPHGKKGGAHVSADKQARDSVTELTDSYKAGSITLTQYYNALNKIAEAHRKNAAIVHEVVNAEAAAQSQISASAKANEAAVVNAAEGEQKKAFDQLKAHLDAQVQLRNISSAQEVQMLKQFSETHKAIAQSQADAEIKAIHDVRDIDEDEKIKAIQRRLRLKEETIAAAIAELQAEAAHYKAIGDAGAAEYAKIMDAVDQLRDQEIADSQKAYEDYQKRLEKQAQDAQKFGDKWATILEQGLSKGKSIFQSIADEFGKMLQQIEHALLASAIGSLFSKMFSNGTGQGVSFGSLFSSSLGSIFGMGEAGTSGAASTAGLLAAATGVSATGVVSSIWETAGNVPTIGAGSAAAGAGGAAASAGGGLSGVAGAGSPLWNKVLGGKLIGTSGPGGKLLPGVAAGLISGQVFGGLFGGGTHTTWGDIGGVLGAIGGLFLPGVGSIVGGAIGGLIGSLFGHADNPAQMPDKYDTQRFGTIVANLQGVAGANGQNFTEDSGMKQLFGGRTGIQFIESYLAQFGSKGNAPAWLQGMWDRLSGMFGISASGSGVLNFGKNIGEQWITGAQGTDGKHYSYLDLGNALQDFVNAYQQNNGASSVPADVFNLSRGGGDLNAGILSYAGTQFPGSSMITIGPGGMGSSGPGGTAPISGGGGGAGSGGGGGMITRPGGGGSRDMAIVINIGSVDSDQRMQQLSAALGDVLNRKVGGLASSNGSRFNS